MPIENGEIQIPNGRLYIIDFFFFFIPIIIEMVPNTIYYSTYLKPKKTPPDYLSEEMWTEQKTDVTFPHTIIQIIHNNIY